MTSTTFLLSLLLGLATMPAEDPTFAVGDVAPGFTLKNINNAMVSLSDYQTEYEGVILVFTCNTCPFSVKYEDRLIALDQTFRPLGFPVVAINPNDVNRKPGDSFEAMSVRAIEKKFPFDYLYDETQEVAAAYGATRTPHAFVLTQGEGGYNCAYIGAIDDNVESASAVQMPYLAQAVEDVIEGREPDPNFTKAIGCTIKWKQQ